MRRHHESSGPAARPTRRRSTWSTRCSTTFGRFPTTAEVAVDSAFAADGIDELLRGFLTRGRAKLFDGEEFTVAVIPSDADRRWVLGVGPKLTVAAGDGSGADATLAGTSAALYLRSVEPRRRGERSRSSRCARTVARDDTRELGLTRHVD